MLWISEHQLILASGSITRSNLLKAAGLEHVVSPAAIDERRLEARLGTVSAASVAEGLARAKALATGSSFPQGVVIGADQTLECDGILFHKPLGVAQAREQLLYLRGKEHRLNSAIAIVRDNTVDYAAVFTARLSVRQFSEAFLNFYLEMAGPSVLASVGCYHIEGLGAQIFDRVEGDQFTVMGLPLLPLLAYFREAGYLRC